MTMTKFQDYLIPERTPSKRKVVSPKKKKKNKVQLKDEKNKKKMTKNLNKKITYMGIEFDPDNITQEVREKIYRNQIEMEAKNREMDVHKAQKEYEESIIRKEKEREEHFQAVKKRILDLGYCFSPMEGQLVDHYLRNKSLCIPMDHCPIEEFDVYSNHPQALTEKCPRMAEVWYFFTQGRPNEIQPGSDVQGHWVISGKKDVYNKGEKVGVKQLIEYCEGGAKSEYKIIEYQLDPAPENSETGRSWFVCKLYIGVGW